MPTQPPDSSADPLAAFSLPTRAWFRCALEEPTAAQAAGWAAISRGESALVVAPTGSGKTAAALLEQTKQRVAAEVDDATDFAEHAPPPPDESAFTHVYATA